MNSPGSFDTAIMHEEHLRTFRMCSDYRNIGIVCTLLFAIIWIATVCAGVMAPEDELKRRIAAFVMPLIVFGFFICLGLWLCVAYFRYRLLLDSRMIRHVGIFATTEIRLSDIRSVRWRLFPQFGSCVITSYDSRIVVEFANFSVDERTELVHYLRENSAVDLQADWDSFRERFLQTSPDKERQKKIVQYLIRFVLWCSAVAFAVAWCAGMGAQYLVIAMVNVFAAIVLGRKQAETEAGNQEEAKGTDLPTFDHAGAHQSWK